MMISIPTRADATVDPFDSFVRTYALSLATESMEITVLQ